MQYAKNFKIRASAIGKIMSGSMGLTEKQGNLLDMLEDKFNNPKSIPMPAGKLKKLNDLKKRESDGIAPLTDKMKKDLVELEVLFDNPKKEQLTEKQLQTMRDLQQIEKNPELPSGAKTYCETWLKEKLYARRKTFTSKYTEKGNAAEEGSIEFLSEQMDTMLMKNEKHYSNDHITGTPDIVLAGMIIDIKNAWDCFTFPLFENELPNKDYYWQMQGYMALTERTASSVVYVLSDAPEHLIDQEARRECYRLGIDTNDADVYDEVYTRMTYGDIPNDRKLKVFDIARDDAAIEQIKERVEACRAYIANLKKSL